jgi:hypothetical protein
VGFYDNMIQNKNFFSEFALEIAAASPKADFVPLQNKLRAYELVFNCIRF